MQTLSAAMHWAYNAIAAWYVAGAIAGLLIFAAERMSRRKPSKSEVKRAADRYHQHYGDAARAVIIDHIFAASFAPDSRHRKFLVRVADELSRGSIEEE